MTTIAANSESMAADWQTSAGNRRGSAKKIHRIRNHIVAHCGGLSDGYRFVRWFRNGGSRPRLSNDFGALVLTPDGSLVEYESNLEPLPVLEKFAALGTGSDAALGALYAGADPYHAVKIAHMVDIYTSSKVSCYRRRT